MWAQRGPGVPAFGRPARARAGGEAGRAPPLRSLRRRSPSPPRTSLCPLSPIRYVSECLCPVLTWRTAVTDRP
eukprot:3247000-Rhodomonas_salina.3